jgi:hypothetical protein
MTETNMDRRTRRLLRGESQWFYRMWIGGAVVVGLAMLLGPNRPFGVFLLVMIAMGFATNLAFPTGEPVTAKTQPELHALVREVAEELGVRRRFRVRLTSRVQVTASVGRFRRELYIGLPVLAFMTRSELRGLIAAELTLLDRPDARLLDRLRDRWGVEEDAPTRALLAPHAAALLPALDRAAVAAAGGPGVAARAYALIDTGGTEYLLYLDDNRDPGRKRYAWDASGIVDWDDGWRRLLERGIGDLLWDAETAAELAVAHPGLTEQLRWLGTRAWPLKASNDPVPAAPLSSAARKRLARQAWEISGMHYVRWRTFASAPVTWWQRRAGEQAAAYRALAAEVTSGPGTTPPGDDVEVVGVLARVDDRPADDDAAIRLAGVVHAAGVLVEDALLRRGWTLAHPAVRGELVGPDGERVDPRAILRAVGEGEQGYPTLRTWLAPVRTDPATG